MSTNVSDANNATSGGPMDFSTWTTKDVVTAIIATGAISALLTNVFGGIRDWVGWWWKSRKDASYMAMRLANVLEAYASECVDLIYANDEAPHLDNHQFPHWSTTLPAIGAYPEDAVGWKAIRRDLADRCLRLPNTIDGCQSLLGTTVEHMEEQIQNEVARHATDLGLEAWDIAVSLRNAHDLAALKPVWDFPKALRDNRMYVLNEDRRRAAINRQYWEEMEIETAD